jgi:diguanylate cyclase (GGDEF)-like protein
MQGAGGLPSISGGQSRPRTEKILVSPQLGAICGRFTNPASINLWHPRKLETSPNRHVSAEMPSFKGAASTRMPDLAVPVRKWQPAGHVWPITVAACLGLSVAVAAWYSVASWEERLARAKFNAVASDYATVLQNGVDDYLDHIVAVRAFYDASQKVDPDEFDSFTHRILGDYAEIMRIVWAPRVTGDERAAFEREARELGLTEFAIKTWSLEKDPSVSPPRDEYFPILYSTIASQRAASFGLDINSEATRSGAISRARDGDVMATAQGVSIRNPIQGQREGFIAVIPVYRQGVPHDTVENRRRNTLGVIATAFPTSAAFDFILNKANLPHSVDLYVYSPRNDTIGLPIYVRGASAADEQLRTKSEASLLDQPHWSATITAGDASWRLIVMPLQEGLITYYRAWLVFAAVLLLFGAVIVYMWASLRHALRLEAANSRILELAQTDLLTNLANRRAFVKRLTSAFTACWHGAPPFAVLYLDIDNFKDVNDTLGHAMGDLLLKEVVHRLKSAVRTDDLVARFGGDEFAIFVPDVIDPAEAGELASRIGNLLAAPFSIKGHKVRITSSIGIALYSADATGPEAMMMQADLALYGAKGDGRNCYRFHSRELDREVHERVRTAEELRTALEHKELELYYQPQVELSTGRIVGLEALIRWNHKTRGLLTPGAFISIAEKTGIILPVGRWVFNEACRQLKLWHAEGIAPPVLSVNVSGVQFKGTAELEREVEESLTRWDILPSDLELELTESVLMEATQRHGNTLEKLRQLGTKLAIDDFGTGYSSLKYLTTYSVNRLKLAPEFVFRVTVDYRNAAVVRAAIRLANELGIEVIAEGVETEAQMRFLLGAGCEQGQGYYFSRPVAVAKATELLRAGRIEPKASPLRRIASSAA